MVILSRNRILERGYSNILSQRGSFVCIGIIILKMLTRVANYSMLIKVDFLKRKHQLGLLCNR